MSKYITAYVDAEVELDVQCAKCGGDLNADISGYTVEVEPCPNCNSISVNGISGGIFGLLDKSLKLIESSSNKEDLISKLVTDIETYKVLNNQ